MSAETTTNDGSCPAVRPNTYTIRITVRHRDVDVLGHANNAVYLVYAQEAAFRHADSAGFGLQRMAELGGYFVVRRNEIEYRRPAMSGDELLVTTRLTSMKGMRATRETTIVDAATGKTVAKATTDYVWVGKNGRRAHPGGSVRGVPYRADTPPSDPGLIQAGI